MKYLIFNLILSVLLFPAMGLSEEAPVDSFILQLQEDKIKVFPPKKMGNISQVIIQNQTHMKIYGKLVKSSSNQDIFVSIPVDGQTSKQLNLAQNDKITFYLLSPPSQEVELKMAAEAYESLK